MTFRVACVGAGYFSQFHIGSWQRMERATLVGVCDRDLSRAQDRAEDTPAFDDITTMLETVKPDLLDIILPPPGHAEAVRAGVAAGVQAIICQKPFCQTLAEAEQMTALAADAGIPLIIHENFRFQPWFRFIKKVLDAGKIGEVLQLTFRLRPGDGQGYDAYLDRQPAFRDMPRLLIHETGVHYVDTFSYLLGPPSHVYADLRQVNPVLKGEDAGYVLFDFPSGARALLDGNRNADHQAENTRCTMGEGLIEGTDGTLTLTGDGAVRFRAFGSLEQETVLPPDTHIGFGGDCTHALQSHVISGLLGHETLENIAADYLRVIRIEEAIYQSDTTQSKVEL